MEFLRRMKLMKVMMMAKLVISSRKINQERIRKMKSLKRRKRMYFRK